MRPTQKSPAAVSELRLRTRTALLGLEDKDVARQAVQGTQLLISDLTADWQHHQVLRDILGLEQCSAAARRLRYRLASYHLDQKGFPKDEKLVQMLRTKVVAVAGVEKQAAALDDLCGLMHSVTRTALAVHSPEGEAASDDAWISTALLRPILHSALKSPESQTAATLYSLAHAALIVVLDSAKPPCMVAAAANALRQMLSGLSSGQTGVVVPEAFQALKQCAEMLGDRMQPPLVERLLQQCAKHAKHGSPWLVRKQAVEALGSLAASLQVYKHADAGWKLEKSASLAVLRSHRAAIEALLADVKYDKIAHVRQAALKVIAEMQRIPMPSPRKAGAPQPESSAASEDDAAGGDNSSTGSQQQENVHQAFVGTEGEKFGAESIQGRPLQSLDGNARRALKHEDTKRSSAASMCSSARMQKRGNQPVMERVARPRGARGMDFGVQVYAKAPPALQEYSQAKSGDGNVGKTPAATDEGSSSPSAAQHAMPSPQGSLSRSPPQETPSCGSGLIDPSPLLQQLQLFQDQLRIFASPVSAASGLQTPQQPSLADQQAETVKPRAALRSPAALELDHQQNSTAASNMQPAEHLAVSSHDSFRQAMMERLHRGSHSLTHALNSVQSPLDPPSAHPSLSSPAQRSERALSPLQEMPIHSKLSPRMGSGGVDRVTSGGHPIRHMRDGSVADTSASSGSPASRALQSIRSVLRSLPETSMSAEGASRVRRASEPSGLGRLSSSWAFSSADTDTDEQETDADGKFCQDGAAEHEDEDQCQSWRLSGVEREVVRILGPRFGSADMSSGRGRSEMSKAKRGSESNPAPSTSGRHHQDGSPQASQPASEEAQSLSPRRPSSASADAQSEISCFTDGSGRLSRVHSNPLFAEEAASGVRQKRGSTGTSLPGDAPSSKEGGAEAESNPAADERIMGALGKVLDTSLKLDSARRPGASIGINNLRDKLSEDLKALQELLDT